MKGPPPSAGELGSDTELTFGERTQAACSLEGAEPGVGEIFAKIGWKVTSVLFIVQHIFVNLEPGLLSRSQEDPPGSRPQHEKDVSVPS